MSFIIEHKKYYKKLSETFYLVKVDINNFPEYSAKKNNAKIFEIEKEAIKIAQSLGAANHTVLKSQ